MTRGPAALRARVVRTGRMAKAESFWRSAAPLVVGRGVAAIVGIGLPAVLARTLDQASYGTYKQLYLVATLALATLQLGLSQSLYYLVPRAADERERRALIGQTQVLLAVIGVVTAAALAAGAGLVAERFSNPGLGALGIPMGLVAGSLIASSPVEVALTARGRPAASAAVLIVTELVRVGAMIAPVALGAGVRGLAWGAAGAGLARWLLSIALLRGVPAIGRAELRDQLRYALPFGGAVLLAMPQQQLHQIFVAARTTPELFAVYAVGCMQIPVVSLLYAPVSETLQVRLAKLERTSRTNEAGRVLADAVDRLALVFLPMCAVLVATAEPALRILYGARYLESATILRIGVLSVAIASLPLDGVLKARARTKTLLAIYAAKLAMTWPAVALGFGAAGPVGAIGAHVAVELATRLVQLGVVTRELRTSAWELLGGGAFARAAALSMGIGAIGTHVARAIVNPWLACAAVGAIAAGAVGLEILWRRTMQPAPA